MITIRYSSADAVRLKGKALKLGRALELLDASSGSKSALRDGYILKASKVDDLVTVNVVEVPGRLVGANYHVESILDPIVGESTIPTLVVNTAPSREAMSPSSAAVAEVAMGERQGAVGRAHAFGSPLPDDPYPLHAAYPAEIEGGVVFVQFFTDEEPPRDAFGQVVITTQPVWLVVMLQWAGIGPLRSISIHEDYVRDTTGFGFYNRYHEGAITPWTPIRYGARVPAAHYSGGRLYIAAELVQDGLIDSATVGGMLVMCVHYPDGAAVEWSHVVGPDDMGSDLSPDVFTEGAGGAPYRVSGCDLPAIFSWVDPDGHNRAVVSYRVRSRRLWIDYAEESYRLVVGQVLLSAIDGAVSMTVDYVDSISELDPVSPPPAPLPRIEDAKIFIQKYRDYFFLDGSGELVRYRRMRVCAREVHRSSSQTSAPIHTDRAIMVTERPSGTVVRTQAALGYGPEESEPGTVVTNGGEAVYSIGFHTPVASGEVWVSELINDSIGPGGRLAGIVRLTATGSTLLASGLPHRLQLSTYQREVRDAEGAVVVPMGQVATILDAGEPKIAIKKGRFGALDFIPAASYSRFGTFYLASPVSEPRYGRMFG